MNTETHEKNLECITLLKEHRDLFTYDAQNDIYRCSEPMLAIANRQSLQAHIERTCKGSQRQKVGRLFNEYGKDTMLAAVYSPDGSRCNILPAMTVLLGRNLEALKQTAREQREKALAEARARKEHDEMIAGTIAAQYDNHLSAEELADINEKEHPIEDREIEVDY